jgi:sulfur relay (sulfurtransferase) DsrF/TusC family protein
MKLYGINIIYFIKAEGGYMKENLDINQMLEALSKMDKKELEEKLKQAKTILNSKDINLDNLKNK